MKADRHSTNYLDDHGERMALTIGDSVPDFTAQTTNGEIRFHDWIGDSCAVLFSHPRAVTPICTTDHRVPRG